MRTVEVFTEVVLIIGGLAALVYGSGQAGMLLFGLGLGALLAGAHSQ